MIITIIEINTIKKKTLMKLSVINDNVTDMKMKEIKNRKKEQNFEYISS